MRIVLDTNVLLPSIRRAGDLYWIFSALLDGLFTLVVSTPILLEYEEVIALRTTPSIAHSVMQVLLALPNVERVEPAFRWRLIDADPDDDKFVDASLAAGAEAVFFESQGYRIESTDRPARDLLDLLQRNQVRDQFKTPHGTKFVVDGILRAPQGMSPRIRTVWIVEKPDEGPRFVTAYPV